MSDGFKTTVAVTGASGFIARGVLELLAEVTQVRALSRGYAPTWTDGRIDWVTLTDYNDVRALSRGLQGVDYVLHLADNPVRDQDRDSNASVQVAAALIEAMQENAVKGAIVASSVYARDISGSYGAAKAAIEREFLSASAPPAIILRLPPVYGPGGRGGIAMLAKLAKHRIPLPVGLANGPRAYLSRRNFASLVCCLVHADEAAWVRAAGSIFEPSDGMRVSTKELVQLIANQMGIRVIKVPVPLALLRAFGKLTGRSDIIAGAIEPLELAGPAELEAAFGWRPIEKMPESLAFLNEEFKSD
ncbi:NAD-dependent epimerase/dehydratase family protein [Mesorhizobium sp.]|uniref:NAD-dependent epimerase/dehydratase family protein n=1 Tax=Mesorhizobium sp. TaxID=1871066 RepID=UPI002580307D|nr:NAD-dependent epimerase/dehydratase family protein [Mesorhizobium sp.]